MYGCVCVSGCICECELVCRCVVVYVYVCDKIKSCIRRCVNGMGKRCAVRCFIKCGDTRARRKCARKMFTYLRRLWHLRSPQVP